ncbi:OsmC family protein [Propylenella binzhouense]|uniref:OsmC family peroxiredoxin n=1 Tax=Propylenella binzhouense TaxID=2555902 RepID=A0A964TAA1_9HYPH|nr:OsmC family protein [Propylenella binzhouense]MYZ50187.1 OsmC family peroxiredoxin [Propylenella binzhouense]
MAQSNRSAEAVWKGSIKEGNGTLTTSTGVLSGVTYSAGSRFGDEAGTNPEELIAAAHAGCFNMALSGALTRAGHPPEELRTTAKITMKAAEGGGFSITDVALTLRGKVPGMAAEDFVKAAEGAKANCPVSKVLNANITLDAQLA